MSNPTAPIDLSALNIGDAKKAFIDPATLALGIGDDVSLNRLSKRLDFLEKSFESRKAVLRAGNIAALEVEVFMTNHLVQDLIDCVREAITLCAVSAFRQEQGLAIPPKARKANENPTPAPLGFDASEQESAAGQVPDEN